MSDLNPPFAEHSSGIGATFYIGGVSVIITNGDDLLLDGFGHMLKLINFMIGGRRQGPMDGSESNFAALTRNGPRHDSQSLTAYLKAAKLVE